MKKVAIIGLGDISQIHVNAIKTIEDVCLSAVCDIDPDKGGIYSELPFYTDYLSLLEHEKPACIHICLPHYLHYPVAKAAAERGIHVFCEKPMATCLKEAVDFLQLEEMHSELQLGICLQNRRNKTTERLKEIIENGQYGKITGIRGFVPWKRTKAYYDQKPWRGNLLQAGSGVLLNQSIHTLDLMYDLGGVVTSLKAMAGQLLDFGVEVEDTVVANLAYADGFYGLFFATNSNDKNESVSLRVELEQAEFLIQNNYLYRILPDGESEKVEEDQKLPGTKFYYGAGHETVIREFYDAMESGSEKYLHVRDAYMSMVLADAIFRSAQTNLRILL